jgi:hypothetical protein
VLLLLPPLVLLHAVLNPGPCGASWVAWQGPRPQLLLLTSELSLLQRLLWAHARCVSAAGVPLLLLLLLDAASW